MSEPVNAHAMAEAKPDSGRIDSERVLFKLGCQMIWPYLSSSRTSGRSSPVDTPST